MRDTPIEVEKRLWKLYAGLTPTERLRIQGQMFEAGIILLKAGILHQRPEITEAQMRGEIVRRLYHDCFSAEEMARIVRYFMQEDK